jgi:hypothetical protein
MVATQCGAFLAMMQYRHRPMADSPALLLSLPQN